MPQHTTGQKQRRQWAPDARALEVVGDRWLMVIVRDLAAGPLRLDELRRRLPGVSAGALESRLARMAEERLLTRRRYRALPPRVDLELTERGRSLLPLVGELARWELATRWSQPCADEWVDVAACFRLAPFLPHADGADDGELALTIRGEDGAEDHYVFVRAGGRACVERRDVPAATTRISGSEDDWVAALSPGEGAPRLRIDGRRPLAEAFLRLFRAG